NLLASSTKGGKAKGKSGSSVSTKGSKSTVGKKVSSKAGSRSRQGKANRKGLAKGRTAKGKTGASKKGKSSTNRKGLSKGRISKGKQQASWLEVQRHNYEEGDSGQEGGRFKKTTVKKTAAMPKSASKKLRADLSSAQGLEILIESKMKLGSIKYILIQMSNYNTSKSTTPLSLRLVLNNRDGAVIVTVVLEAIIGNDLMAG
ncbi:17575_t:CDS:2, partial [Acaulospora colombiana]